MDVPPHGFNASPGLNLRHIFIAVRLQSDASPDFRRQGMEGKISYLRIIVTTRCPLRCAYCHGEGSRVGQQGRDIPADTLVSLIAAGIEAGMHKVKLLGGEPLLHPGLPEVLRRVRCLHPQTDISAISSGVVAVRRLEECLAAGLSRCNVTVHGWSPTALSERGASKPAHARRARFIERLLAAGRPVKVNYVYTSPDVEPDLAGLLEWAADRPVVVGVLDDLSNLALGPTAVEEALVRLRGEPVRRLTDHDPHSLSTTHLLWEDGLRVEVKDQRLGAVAPWRACAACRVRERCREGILALRITENIALKPCMDREDLTMDLRPVLCQQRHQEVARTIAGYIAREAA